MLNTNNQIDYKALLISQLLGLLASLIVIFLIGILPALFITIKPETTYGWFGGIWQGIFSIANFIISLFREDWLIIAPSHTIAYSVFFWFNCITEVIAYIKVYAKIFSDIAATIRADRS